MRGKHSAIATRRRETQDLEDALAGMTRRAERAEREAATLSIKLSDLDSRFRSETRRLRAEIAGQRPPALVAAEEENARLSDRVRALERRIQVEYDLSIECYQAAADALEARGMSAFDADMALGFHPESRFLKGERGEALIRARGKRHGSKAALNSGTRLPTKNQQMGE